MLLACLEKRYSVDCADVPPITWNNFGHGFMLERCGGCHNAAQSRAGAPKELVFETPEQVWAYREEILEATTQEPLTMPPAGGTTEDERTELQWWLICGEEGT
jgi:uncharacterized membrane protein